MKPCANPLKQIRVKSSFGLWYTELQKEGVLRIIRTYFFLFLNKNICCDPSLEPSRLVLDETVLMMGYNIRFKGIMWQIIH